MTMIKNLTVANIKKIEGMVRRENLDFSDDGNRFRGFSYKGMPITTLRSDDTTYLSIRVDYLENNFTWEEWRATEEYKLEDEFNGVSEIDLDKLIDNLERIIAKVDELNAKAENEVVDITEVKKVLRDEIMFAEDVVMDFKRNFKWYEVESYRLNSLVNCLKSELKEIDRVKEKLENIENTTRRERKEMVERLNKYGYVSVRKDSYYLEQMINALK